MTSSKWVFVVGRVLFGGFFLFNGFNHFAHTGMMVQYAAAKGVPMPQVAVTVAAVLLVIGGLSLLFGYLPRVGIAALVLFLVPVTLYMHAFWKDADPQARTMDVVNFAKNVALLGGILSLIAIPEPWPVSVGEAMRVRVPQQRKATP